MITPILKTPRLTLRPLQGTDAARIQALFPHYEVLKYMTAAIPWPYPADGAKQFVDGALASMTRKERCVWAIVENAAGDDRLIGCIDLFPNRADDQRGFWLGLPYQGKGYMTEAVAAVTDFCVRRGATAPANPEQRRAQSRVAPTQREGRCHSAPNQRARGVCRRGVSRDPLASHRRTMARQSRSIFAQHRRARHLIWKNRETPRRGGRGARRARGAGASLLSSLAI